MEEFSQLHGRQGVGTSDWFNSTIPFSSSSTASRPLPHTCPTRRLLQRTRSIASGQSALLCEHQGDSSADGHITIAPTPAMLDALLRPSPFPPSAVSPGRCSPSVMPAATTEARSQPPKAAHECGPTVVRRSHGGCELCECRRAQSCAGSYRSTMVLGLVSTQAHIGDS